MGVIGSDHSKRVVYLSAFGVGAELKQHALLFRLVLKLSSLGGSYEDHDHAEALPSVQNRLDHCATTWIG